MPSCLLSGRDGKCKEAKEKQMSKEAVERKQEEEGRASEIQ